MLYENLINPLCFVLQFHRGLVYVINMETNIIAREG